MGSAAIDGQCDEKFAEVADEFERNFNERDELGASVAITVDGETVVDLWGGIRDEATGAAWENDTMSVVWSSTKGATALCAHVLSARGEIDLDAPVTDYWPEFGEHGKEKVTVAMMLSHQSGVPVLSEKVPDGKFYDWDYMVDALAKQKPFWEIGHAHGYQGLTFGWLIGEIVRRVSGKSLGQFFHDEIAKPLGIEFWIGAPESVEERVAPMIFPDLSGDDSAFLKLMFADPKSLPALMVLNSGGYMSRSDESFDSRSAHAAELGGSGGITNARGLAGMYAPLACGGELNGVKLVGEKELARMGHVVAAGRDQVLQMRMRYTLGFWGSMDNRREPTGTDSSIILSPDAFGHPGMGGSVGFAAPTPRASFGYTMNRMGSGAALNERGQSMVDAMYRALGYRSNAAAYWA